MSKELKTVLTKERKDLLFLHGYLADRNSFNYQLGFFDRDFNVFAPDLKGFGKNRGMDYPYSLDDYLLEVKEFIYKNGLKKPHVIAHSFGGRIAIKGAATCPNLFDKLVLTGCAGLKPKRTLKSRCKKVCFSVLKNFVPRKKLKMFYSKDYLALGGVMRQSFSLIVKEHLDGYLDKIENRTLIVFGKDDKETPVYMAKRLHRGIKNSSLILFDGAGHFCFIDKPLKFNTEVKEFLLS